MKSALLFVSALLVIAAPASARPQNARRAPAARTRDWSRTVAVTPAGGFVMGNPAASVKLIEFGSLTCPHCRHFDQEGVPALIANYVRPGRVSWEFRPYLINGIDIAATLTAQCGGPRGFFPLMRALYATQPQWAARVRAIPEERMTRIAAMSPEGQTIAVGQAANFPAFAAARGVPAAKINACLGDLSAIKRLTEITAAATEVRGTPAFMVNGALVDYSAGPTVWTVVEARLKAAL